jgi:hypothetical protein
MTNILNWPNWEVARAVEYEGTKLPIIVEAKYSGTTGG